MPPQQPPAVAAQPNHHHSSLTPTGLTGLSHHFNHNGGQYHHYHNQMTSHDFKPQYLADWYSHGVTSIGGMSRYDPASVASKPTQHRAFANSKSVKPITFVTIDYSCLYLMLKTYH